MWLVIALSLGAADPWTDPLSHHDGLPPGAQPKVAQMRIEFDDVLAAVKVWQREKRELLQDQLKEQQRVQRQMRDAAPISDEALKKYKIVEVTKSGRTRNMKSRAKVIELPPREGIDAQLDQLELEAAARQQVCAEDPGRCAREKHDREELERGNEEFDHAVEVNFEKRRAGIEAEARRFQAQLEAAKRKDAEAQAARMGGSLDTEGNFVDSDLKVVPVRPEPAKP